MPAGQWVAFDVLTEESHVCGVKNKPDVSVKLKGKKKPKIKEGDEDFGIKIDDLDGDINEETFEEVEEIKTYDSVSGIHKCIDNAIKNKKRIYIEYNSDHNQEFTEREISPVKKFKDKGRTYLQAYCHKRKGERIFLTRSISSASPVNKKMTKIKLGKPKLKNIKKIDEIDEEDFNNNSNNFTSEVEVNEYEPAQQEQGERKGIFYYFIMFVAVPIWIYVLIMGLIEMGS
tara:strand:- start:1482 stop:2171 length:690 start_codon:yes stop_codon:yes gene_type:complete